MLTPRQVSILRKVVEGYGATGQPIASRTLAGDPELACAPSTIRNELALLEEHGLLAHPHTSSGRVPTDAGQRYLVDRLLESPAGRAVAAPVALSPALRELDDALRVTTETLSQMTNLLAVASAPAAHRATIRHVEVLTLAPAVVMVVVITSAGGVSKYLAAFEHPVDQGLVAWAGEYLDERVRGAPTGARMLRQRLVDPDLDGRERAFIEQLAPAFSQLADGAEDVLYVDGTARLLGARRFSDVGEVNELMWLIEERVALLDVLRRAIGARGGISVRIGGENDVPGLQTLALVAAGYGAAQRRVGTVSVIGPVRMDYATAIDSVRGVALQLSRFVEDVYDSGL
jgi:heat-inducible transcriptional repressor